MFHHIAPQLTAIFLSLFSAFAAAQPNAAPSDQYGDRQAGKFGDTGQGYFGNPGAGNFTRYRFPRDQEGRILPSPAVPLRSSRVTIPPELPAASPYVMLPAPAEQ